MQEPSSSANESRWSYLKVAERIRQEILKGTYKAGRRLPGEHALARRFKVGRVTVARALHVLEQSRLVFRVRGSGTYIQRDAARGSARLTIGYLVNEVGAVRNSPHGLTLEAAHKRIEDLGHTVRLLTRSEVRSLGEPGPMLRRMVRAGSLDGLILSYEMYTPEVRSISRVLPIVALLSNHLPPGTHNVAVDFALGYFLAARHLLDLGHRKIGLLGGGQESSIGYRALVGFRLAVQTAGLDLALQPVAPCGYESQAYPAAAQAMLRGHPDLTGVVCIDDIAAESVVEAASRMGCRVPQDISVVGCNDMPSSSVFNPPLTTLSIDFALQGTLGVDLLMDVMSGRQTREQIYLEPKLVVRSSTGPPPVLGR